MDLLKTILIYLTLLFTSSGLTSPEIMSVPAAVPTPVVAVKQATPAPVATPVPTPVPTINITPNPDYKTLKMGDKGEAVFELQTRLTDLGYYNGDVDGRFGRQTRTAVMHFQYQHGLAADGIAGKRTLTVLLESDEVRPAPTPTPKPTPTSAIATAVPTAVPTVTPTFTPTPSPSPTPTPAPTATPTPVPTPTPAPTAKPIADKAVLTDAVNIEDNGAADTAAAKATARPSATPVPTPTPTPIPTPTPTPTPTPIDPMTVIPSYTLYFWDSEAPLKSEAGEILHPYCEEDTIYLPLLDILYAANMNSIIEDNLNKTEIAFAAGEQIIRFSFTEDQQHQPIMLEAFADSKPIALSKPEMRKVGNSIYFTAETLKEAGNISWELSDENHCIYLEIPTLED